MQDLCSAGETLDVQKRSLEGIVDQIQIQVQGSRSTMHALVPESPPTWQGNLDPLHLEGDRHRGQKSGQHLANFCRPFSTRMVFANTLSNRSTSASLVQREIDVTPVHSETICAEVEVLHQTE